MTLPQAIAASADIQCDNLEQRDKIVAWLNVHRLTELRSPKRPIDGLYITFLGFDEYIINTSLLGSDKYPLIPATQFLTSNNI